MQKSDGTENFRDRSEKYSYHMIHWNSKMTIATMLAPYIDDVSDLVSR